VRGGTAAEGDFDGGEGGELPSVSLWRWGPGWGTGAGLDPFGWRQISVGEGESAHSLRREKKQRGGKKRDQKNRERQ